MVTGYTSAVWQARQTDKCQEVLDTYTHWFGAIKALSHRNHRYTASLSVSFLCWLDSCSHALDKCVGVTVCVNVCVCSCKKCVCMHVFNVCACVKCVSVCFWENIVTQVQSITVSAVQKWRTGFGESTEALSRLDQTGGQKKYYKR